MTTAPAPRRLRRWPLTWWDLLHEPPVVTAGAAVVYAALAIFGTLSIFHPPGTITSELGNIVTYGWAVFSILGGILGVASAPSGIWWLERVGLYAVATFLLIYTLTVVNLQITSSGSRWMQLGLISMGWYFIVSRWDRTKGAALDPTRGIQKTTNA